MSDRKKTLNYLIYDLNYTSRQAHAIIAKYGETIGKPIPDSANAGYYSEVGEHIQKDWQKFMDFYGTIKEDFKARRSQSKNEKNKTRNNPHQKRNRNFASGLHMH